MNALPTTLLALLLVSLVPGQAWAAQTVTVDSGAMHCATPAHSAQHNALAPQLAMSDEGDLTITAAAENFNVTTPCTFEIVFDGFVVKGANPQGSVTKTLGLPCVAVLGTECEASLLLHWSIPFAAVECGPAGCTAMWTSSFEISFHYEVNGALVGSPQTLVFVHGPSTL